MADDRIDIVIEDKVAPSIQKKIYAIADTAERAGTAVDRLREHISSLNATPLQRFNQAFAAANNNITKHSLLQQKLATEVQKTGAAFMKAEQETLRAVKAEQEAAVVAQKLIVAQQQAARATAQAAAAQARLAAQHERTTASARRTEEVHKAVVNQVNNLGQKTAFTRNQLMTFQYTFNDVVASLGSGISPMTILLQQGGQVTQAFGGLRGTISAVTGAMGPFGLVAAAVAAVLGTVGMAALGANKEIGQLQGNLRITGNYAGITAGQYVELGNRVADATNKSVSASREVVGELAKTGKFQKSQLEQLGTTALLLGTYTGQTADKIIESFERAKEGPTKYAQEMNSQFHFLSSAQLAHIRELESMGQKTAAFEEVTKKLYEYLGKNGPQNLGYLETAWNSIGKAISNAWTALKDWGREQTPEEKVNALQKSLAAVNATINQKLANKNSNPFGNTDKVVKDLEATRDSIQAQLNAQSAIVAKTQDQATAAAQVAKIQEDGANASGRLSEKWNDIGDNAAAANREIKAFNKDIQDALRANPNDQEALNALKNKAKIEKEIREKHSESLRKGSQEYESAKKQAEEYIRTIKLETAQLEEVEGRHIALAAAKVAEKAPTKALREEIMRLALAHIQTKKNLDERIASEKLIQQYADAYTKQADDVWQQVRALQEQVKTYGLTKTAVIDLAVVQVQAQLQSIELTEQETRALESKLAALNALRGEQFKLDQLDTSKALREDFKRTADDVAGWLRDGIREGLTSGGSFIKSLTNSIKAAFANLVLNPIIQPLASFGASMLNPAGAQASGVTGAANSFGSIANAISTGKTLVGAFTGGLASSLGGIAQSAGSMFGSAALTEFGAGMQGATLAAGQMGATTVGASGAMGAGASAAAAIPYVAIAIAVAMILKKGLGMKTVGSGITGSVAGTDFLGAGYEYKKGGFLRGGDKTVLSDLDKSTDKAFDSAVSTTIDGFNRLGTAIGAGSDIMKGFAFNFRLALADFDEAGKEKEIQRMMSAMTDSMANTFVDKFRTSVDTVQQQQNSYFTNTVDGNRTFTGGVVQQNAVSSPLEPYRVDMLRIFDTFKDSLKGVEGSEGQLTEFTAKLFTLGDSLARNAGFAELFGEAVDFKKLESAKQVGEDVFATIDRLQGVFAVTNAVAITFGKDFKTAFGAVGLASSEARQNLVDLAGGIDALVSKTQFFAEKFLSEAQQLKPASDSVAKLYAQYGLAGNSTRKQIAAFVNGLDLSTEAGRKAKIAFYDAAPAIDALITSTDRLAEEAKKTANDLADAYKALADKNFEDAKNTSNNALEVLSRAIEKEKQGAQAAYDAQIAIIDAQKTSVEELFNNRQDGLQSAIDALKDTVGNWQKLTDNLQSTLDGLILPGNEGANRIQAQAQIKGALAIARAGGMPDADSLSNALKVVSQPSEGLFTSFEDYATDFYKTANDINTLNGFASNQLTVEQRALKATEEQLEILKKNYDEQKKGFEDAAKRAKEQLEATNTRLDLMYQNAKDQLDAALGTKIATMSTADAMKNFVATLPALISAKNTAATANATTGGLGSSVSNAGTVANWYASTPGAVSNPDAAAMAFWTGKIAEAGGNTASVYSLFQQVVKDNPQHAGGLTRVPYNGYETVLHAGERVLNANEAREYNNGYNEQVLAKIDELVDVIMTGQGSMVANLNAIRKVADLLENDLIESQDA